MVRSWEMLRYESGIFFGKNYSNLHKLSFSVWRSWLPLPAPVLCMADRFYLWKAPWARAAVMQESVFKDIPMFSSLRTPVLSGSASMCTEAATERTLTVISFSISKLYCRMVLFRILLIAGDSLSNRVYLEMPSVWGESCCWLSQKQLDWNSSSAVTKQWVGQLLILKMRDQNKHLNALFCLHWNCWWWGF